MIYHKRHFGGGTTRVCPVSVAAIRPPRRRRELGLNGHHTALARKEGRRGERRTAEYFIPSTIFVADFRAPGASDDKRVCAGGS